MQVLRSVIGDQNYEDAVSSAVADIQKHMDESVAGEVKAYVEAQTASSSALEANSKLIEQWNALSIYRTAVKLAKGGNKVYVMYWAEKPLIENLGSGTVDAAAALLGTGEALQMYGSVMNEDLSETLQALLQKYVNGQALQLYPNEIRGVDAVDWKVFPRALIVSDGKLVCDTIEDRITEVEGLLDFAVS
jgi:para-nitrobenzyl esterase